MLNRIPKLNAIHLLAIFGLIGLAGCGSINQISETTASVKPSGYLVTLKVTDGSDQATLETRYAGKALVFDAASGFAMLHTTNAPDKTDPAVKSVEADSTSVAPDTRTGTEVQLDGTVSSGNGSTVWSSGSTVWGSGSYAWGSGSVAWGSGSVAWGSGSTVWGSGTVVPALPIENKTTWNQIKLYEAHRMARNFGGGIKVAVIDSGIDLQHSVFAGKLSPSTEFWDYVGNDATPQDEAGGNGYGHGTAVAGIILQVAPRATILPIRVLRSDGTANTSDVVSAIARAVNANANIINLSLGTVGYDQSLMDICNWANSRGVRIVAAAGNNGQFNNIDSPALFGWETGYEGWTVGVGSVNANDQRSSFSSYGDDLYVYAPGENIWSAYPGNKSANFTGTSFAAPIYAGALALGLSEMPSAHRASIQNALWGTAYDGPGMDWGAASFTATDGSIMGGRLNLEKFVRNLPGWTAPTDIQAGVYQLVSVNSGKCVNVAANGPATATANNAMVQQLTCTNTESQKWRIEPAGSGLYKLTAMHSGRVMAIPNALMTNDTKMVQLDYANISNQKFSIEVSGSAYKLVINHSAKCLDVPTSGTAEGLQLQQYTCNGTAAQQFKLNALF
jgi:thermitase